MKNLLIGLLMLLTCCGFSQISCPVNDQLSGGLTDGIHRASNIINSNATILQNSDVEFKAGIAVELESGFTTEFNVDFLAAIEDCVAGNFIEWVSFPPSVMQGGTYTVEVNYSLDQDGVIQILLLDEAWGSLVDEYIVLSAGSGTQSFTFTVNGTPSVSTNYLQAKLLDISWNELIPKIETILPAFSSFGLIAASDPPLTEYHTVFPILYNTNEHGNPNPQNKQLQDAAGSSTFYSYQTNWYVGDHWQGPIKAFWGPVSNAGGVNFWMEWNNQQIADASGNTPHAETDVRAQKHKWAWGSASKGYPKQIAALPASVNCTANGQWTQGSAGRAHINMTVWVTSTDNIDDSNTERCDIIIHGWDNSGNMSANNTFNIIGTITSGATTYEVIQRPGDEGEKASFNLVPMTNGQSMTQRSPLLGIYPDTSTQYFNMDVKDIIDQLMAMAVDGNNNPIFDNSWYLTGCDWTITAQSQGIVDNVIIPPSKGRWTFNAYHIDDLN